MPAICLNTGFVAYLAELFTTKHVSSNANEYKKNRRKMLKLRLWSGFVALTRY